MAKVTPPQEIPSGLLDGYRGALGEKRPDDGVRKRYPYRVPPVQTLVGHPTKKQKTQRDRFNLAVERFNKTPGADRQRWYGAMPPWESLLWYYDYFILSALMYDANINQGGLGVIKLIQVMKASCPTTGGHTFTLGTEVVGAKTVVMMFGSARKVPRVLRGSGAVAVGGSTLALGTTVDPAKCTIKLNGVARKVPRVIRGLGAVAVGGSTLALGTTVDPAKCTIKLDGVASLIDAADDQFFNVPCAPYVFSLTTTQITIKWSIAPDQAANVGWEVTEHVESACAPYVFSLTTTQITIKWSITPGSAANIGWEVTEHVEGAVFPVLVSISNTEVAVDWAEEPDAAADVSIIAIEYI